MELTHRFSVPTPVEATWAYFGDIAEVAECFPGATVTSAEGSTFSGTVKVKLGPISLLYNGSGTFVEKDESAHRFVVEAKGKDKRGNGTASATVTLTMTGNGGSTDVEVATDLAITGKPAQFGRGVMQEVSDKLLGQFVGCLEQRLTPQPNGIEAGAGTAAADAADQDAGPASVPTGAAASAEPPAADQDAGPASAPAEPQAEPQAGPKHLGAPARDDSLDLGATVLPVLARTYWRQGLAVFAVLALVWWWIARRRD